ncbi:MAG: HesA/MoeB/ThiF family protein [Promethearchaeota archaeon]
MANTENREEEHKENRYTRLKSIKEFGYDVDWDDLRDKSATIAGVGGLGMISAEMLGRCGIGALYLFDKDEVQIVNLNRMGFNEKDINTPKVNVIRDRLGEINPDVKVEAFHGDIMLFSNENTFEQCVKKSDVVLMGVDNYPARTFVNQKCINLNIPLIDAGASRSALSGHVHPIFPGKNGCLRCTGIIHALEKTERGEPCTASLPTTMAIIAAVQVQETLKFLLNLGKNIDYMTYNALTGQFSNHITKRDPSCPACGHLN